MPPNKRLQRTRRERASSVGCVGEPLKRSPFNFMSMRRSAIILSTAVALILIGCDTPDTAIDVAMDGKLPLTFSFSGPWWAIDFEVIELGKIDPAPENQYSSDQKTIWKISLKSGMRVKSWPKVTYGVLPNGFSQSIPSDGKPPALVEGKRYAAQAVDTSRAGGAIYFVIRNGKITSAPEASLLKEVSP